MMEYKFLNTSVALFVGSFIEFYYGDSLRAERSGDRIPVEAKFSAPVQTDAGAYPTSVKWVPGLFPGDKAVGAWR
jgi:hypothetical protein